MIVFIHAYVADAAVSGSFPRGNPTFLAEVSECLSFGETYLVDSSLVSAFIRAALDIEVVLHLLVVLKSKTWVGKAKRKEKVQDEGAQSTSNVKVHSEEYKLQHDSFKGKR